MLTEHKLKWQASAPDFLARYSEEGDNFLTYVITGYETWVSLATSESKQQSMEWRHTSSPRQTKFKPTTSTQKIMCKVFWDREGVVPMDFLPQGPQSMQVSIVTHLTKLHHAIQNKQCGLLSQGVLMVHDNACPHTTAAMQNLIMKFGWEQFNHAPFSPD
jgi:hypothetical protein